SPSRTELVDKKLRAGVALQVLEEQSFPANVSLPIPTFRNPVGNFRDLQNRVRFRADALQFAGSVECFDPIPQIVVGQNSSRDDRRLYDGSPVPAEKLNHREPFDFALGRLRGTNKTHGTHCNGPFHSSTICALRLGYGSQFCNSEFTINGLLGRHGISAMKISAMSKLLAL